jgi:hypothetical protein
MKSHSVDALTKSESVPSVSSSMVTLEKATLCKLWACERVWDSGNYTLQGSTKTETWL